MHRVLLRPWVSPSTTKLQRIGRYATQAAGNPALQVFNRDVKYLQKERAAANVETSRQTDYLKDEIAQRLCERLLVSPPTLYERVELQ